MHVKYSGHTQYMSMHVYTGCKENDVGPAKPTMAIHSISSPKLECVLHSDKQDTLYSLGLLFFLTLIFAWMALNDFLNNLLGHTSPVMKSRNADSECQTVVSTEGRKNPLKRVRYSVAWQTVWRSNNASSAVHSHLPALSVAYLMSSYQTSTLSVTETSENVPVVSCTPPWCALPAEPDGARNFNIVQGVFCLHRRRCGKLRAQRGVDPPVSSLLAREPFYSFDFFPLKSQNSLWDWTWAGDKTHWSSSCMDYFSHAHKTTALRTKTNLKLLWHWLAWLENRLMKRKELSVCVTTIKGARGCIHSEFYIVVWCLNRRYVTLVRAKMSRGSFIHPFTTLMIWA